jgi:Zn-finger nucleic acid-binding protein
MATMNCPVDGTQLVMSERQNIEIDYCPTCRGVWLDRGELDKIIERSAAAAPEPSPPRGMPPQPMHPQGMAPNPWGHSGHHKGHKRRKSFLEELFD